MFGVADKRFGRVFILLAALAGALLVIWGAGFSGAKKAEAGRSLHQVPPGL